MQSIQKRLCVAVSITLYALSVSAHALTINTNFVPAGSNIPGIGIAESPMSNTVGGGNLESIVRAAADAWEALILDDFTLTVDFGWFPTSPISSSAYHQGISVGGNPSRETVGSLAFNSDYNGSFPFFLDPTPETNEEYVFAQQDFADYGGGNVEIRREYSGTTSETSFSRDFYSVALHEIGHALGLTGWNFFNTETADGDIDVDLAPFAGSEIPMSSSHLEVVGPVMSYIGRPIGSRRDITQIDLLAVCQLSQFDECNLDLRPTGPPGDFDDDGDVDGFDFLAWQRGESPNSGSADDLTDWETNFGTSVGSLSGFAAGVGAIPEPSTTVLLSLALVGLAAGRRRQR